MMNISYLGRKTTIRDSFKEYAQKRLKRLEKFFDDDPNVTIVVTNEGDEETVEVTIKSKGMFFRGRRPAGTARYPWLWWRISSPPRLSGTKTGWSAA